MRFRLLTAGRVALLPSDPWTSPRATSRRRSSTAPVSCPWSSTSGRNGAGRAASSARCSSAPSRERAGKVELVKVDTDANQTLARDLPDPGNPRRQGVPRRRGSRGVRRRAAAAGGRSVPRVAASLRGRRAGREWRRGSRCAGRSSSSRRAPTPRYRSPGCCSTAASPRRRWRSLSNVPGSFAADGLAARIELERRRRTRSRPGRRSPRSTPARSSRASTGCSRPFPSADGAREDIRRVVVGVLDELGVDVRARSRVPPPARIGALLRGDFFAETGIHRAGCSTQTTGSATRIRRSQIRSPSVTELADRFRGRGRRRGRALGGDPAGRVGGGHQRACSTPTTARAAAIQLSASYVDGEFWLLIADDGSGLRPRGPHSGLGLGLALIAQLADDFQILEPLDRRHRAADAVQARRAGRPAPTRHARARSAPGIRLLGGRPRLSELLARPDSRGASRRRPPPRAARARVARGTGAGSPGPPRSR